MGVISGLDPGSPLDPRSFPISAPAHPAPPAPRPVPLRRDTDNEDLSLLSTVLVNLANSGIAGEARTTIERAINKIAARIEGNS